VADILPDSELLNKFETETLQVPYREYFAAKRHNSIANVRGFRALWDCFMLLDKIWTCELEDTRGGLSQSKAVPLFLFVNAHAKVRIALELGFSSCLPETRSLLRDAVESVAHGHRLCVEPELVVVWLRKNEDQASLKAWNEEFWRQKEARLFNGLPKLHQAWRRFSEWGSHTNLGSLAQRFLVEQTSTTVTWKMNYTGVPPEHLIGALFGLLHVFSQMEEVLYGAYESRLKFDTNLESMRHRFSQDKERVRIRIRELTRPKLQQTDSAKAATP
jgi:hypothetical protein